MCLILVATTCFSKAPEDAAQLLSQNVSQFHHMTASFHQTVNDDQGNLLQVSVGRVMIQKPNQFRWEVNIPEREQVICDGKTIWFYQPNLKQVTIRRLDKSVSQTPLMLLAGENIDWSKQFEIYMKTKLGKNRLIFQLVPRNFEGEPFKEITLYFYGNQLVEMDIMNILDQTTQIRFSDIHGNETVPLASSHFIFETPRGIDIIDQTVG